MKVALFYFLLSALVVVGVVCMDRPNRRRNERQNSQPDEYNQVYFFIGDNDEDNNVVAGGENNGGGLVEWVGEPLPAAHFGHGLRRARGRQDLTRFFDGHNDEERLVVQAEQRELERARVQQVLEEEQRKWAIAAEQLLSREDAQQKQRQWAMSAQREFEEQLAQEAGPIPHLVYSGYSLRRSRGLEDLSRITEDDMPRLVAEQASLRQLAEDGDRTANIVLDDAQGGTEQTRCIGRLTCLLSPPNDDELHDLVSKNCDLIGHPCVAPSVPNSPLASFGSGIHRTRGCEDLRQVGLEGGIQRTGGYGDFSDLLSPHDDQRQLAQHSAQEGIDPAVDLNRGIYRTKGYEDLTQIEGTNKDRREWANQSTAAANSSPADVVSGIQRTRSDTFPYGREQRTRNSRTDRHNSI